MSLSQKHIHKQLQTDLHKYLQNINIGAMHEFMGQKDSQHIESDVQISRLDYKVLFFSHMQQT